MSPLVSTPNRGYADWQRVENWDSPILFASTSNIATGAAQVTPVLDVSRYAYLGGYDVCSLQLVQVSMNWYTDAAAANLIGSRIFILDPNMVNPVQYRIPNLGPFVQVTYTCEGGALAGHRVQLIGTNRAHPLEIIPPNSVLIPQLSWALGPDPANQILRPSWYYAGPMQIWAQSAGGFQFRVTLLGYNVNAGLIELFDQTLNSEGSFTTIAPTGGWFVQVENLATNSDTYSLTAQGTQTGAT